MLVYEVPGCLLCFFLALLIPVCNGEVRPGLNSEYVVGVRRGAVIFLGTKS